MMMTIRFQESPPSYFPPPQPLPPAPRQSLKHLQPMCDTAFHGDSRPSAGLIVPQRIDPAPPHFQPHQIILFDDRASTTPGIFLEDLTTHRARLTRENDWPFDKTYPHERIFLQISWPGYATLGTWITIQTDEWRTTSSVLARDVAWAFKGFIDSVQGLPFPSTTPKKWKLLSTPTYNVGGFTVTSPTSRRPGTGLEFDQLKLRSLVEVKNGVWQAEIEVSV
ncbi:hypothetical protein FRC03_002262 [Tulasnella sp. 419]|nr:hypothetical protein FRC03_002262 [Tulasnella sp. 419]